MISIRYSIPPPLISRYTSVISEATGFNYIAIRRHIVGFNPCFLEGRDYRCKTAKLISKPFQSTLPRRERQVVPVSPFQDPFVSIHAPTKGATLSQLPENLREITVSIHAPTKGATSPLLGCRPVCGFNPRSHEGSDRRACAFARATTTVSIHAPTKGATSTI